MRFRNWLAGLVPLSAAAVAGCQAILGSNPLQDSAPTAIPTSFSVATLPPGGAIEGRVWHDLCPVWGEIEPGLAAPDGCAADDRGGFRANGTLDPGEPGIGGVVLRLGQGLCPAAPLAEATTSADGSYRFGGLSAGNYCVSLDPSAGANSPILLPGGWTYPLGVDGETSISIVLPSDEVRQELSFGWDYELLPVPLGPLPTETSQPSPTPTRTPSPTPTPTPSRTSTRTATPSSFPDWKGEYFANRNLSGTPALVRNDEDLDFNWGSSAPAPELPANDFSVRWTRKPSFSKATYRFTLRADDGVRLYVDGKKILDEWHESSGNEDYTVERAMDGKHTIVVEYYERAGNARVEISWKKLNTPTPTATVTPSATPTPTFSPTPTDTSVPVDTDTPTPTPTDTPAPSATPTPTPSDTPTPTETTPPP